MSLVDKDVMRNRLQKVYDNQIKGYLKATAAKRIKIAEAKAAQVGLRSMAEALAGSTMGAMGVPAGGCDGIIVVQIDFGSDCKVAKKIQEKLKGYNTLGSFFIASLDEEGDKVALFPMVSPVHVASGLKANEWIDHCFATLGKGRGGGNADTANGNIPGGQETMDLVLAAAKEFALSKV